MARRERGSVIFCAYFDLAEVRCLIAVPGRGLEPLWISPPDPKSGASANFATLAKSILILAQILVKQPLRAHDLGKRALRRVYHETFVEIFSRALASRAARQSTKRNPEVE